MITELIKKEQEDRDIVEITQVINLYGMVLDSHSWELMDQIFTEDAIAEFGPASAKWTSLEEFTYGFKIFHESLDNHMHSMFAPVIKVDGDTATAFTYGDWLLVRAAAATEEQAIKEGYTGDSWTGRGWYSDKLIRTEKGWRICHRICRLVYWYGNPYVSKPAPGQKPNNTTFRVKTYKEEGKEFTLKAMYDELKK